jgi:hypothetical protein
MITILLAIVGTMFVSAWGFTIAQWRRASEGYEDQQGFHFGPDPRRDRDGRILQAIPVKVDFSDSLVAARRD